MLLRADEDGVRHTSATQCDLAQCLLHLRRNSLLSVLYQHTPVKALSLMDTGREWDIEHHVKRPEIKIVRVKNAGGGQETMTTVFVEVFWGELAAYFCYRSVLGLLAWVFMSQGWRIQGLVPLIISQTKTFFTKMWTKTCFFFHTLLLPAFKTLVVISLICVLAAAGSNCSAVLCYQGLFKSCSLLISKSPSAMTSVLFILHPLF